MSVLNNILLKNGFVLVDTLESEYFGDTSINYELDTIEIRIIKSKSNLSLDIRIKNDEWFDVGLLRNLLLNQENLTNKISSEEFEKFLEDNLKTIIELFSKQNYNITRIKIKDLEKKRAKQMFGKHYPTD